MHFSAIPCSILPHGPAQLLASFSATNIKQSTYKEAKAPRAGDCAMQSSHTCVQVACLPTAMWTLLTNLVGNWRAFSL